MRNNKGFTLVELIVVIAIMGIILILALPQVSKIQSANKNKKYDAYYEAIERGTKLYIDSWSKDLFGNNSSGCIIVKYSELKKNNLVKDFGDKDITCSDDAETYVEVRKVNDTYLYSTSLVCHDDNGVVYQKKDTPSTGVCVNKVDEIGPNIEITPSSHDWVQTEDLKIKIKISDDYTLDKNIGIIYYWTNSDNVKVSSEYTYNYKNKKGVKQVSYEIPTKKIPSDSGEYRLVVKPWYSTYTNGIQDVLGNQTVSDTVAGLYKIDNTKPTCGSATGAKNVWTRDDFTISQNCSDDTSGCVKNSYSKKFTSTTVTYTFDIEDNAGNKNTCTVDVYLDKTAPTKPSGGAIGEVSGNDTSGSIMTEVSGSKDNHSGFKQYLYMVTNSSEKPSNTDSGFTTSKEFARSCGMSYYAWAVAEDNVGNRSEVVSLGSTKDEACCSESNPLGCSQFHACREEEGARTAIYPTPDVGDDRIMGYVTKYDVLYKIAEVNGEWYVYVPDGGDFGWFDNWWLNSGGKYNYGYVDVRCIEPIGVTCSESQCHDPIVGG